MVLLFSTSSQPHPPLVEEIHLFCCQFGKHLPTRHDDISNESLIIDDVDVVDDHMEIFSVYLFIFSELTPNSVVLNLV